jgi:hypothetical protein
MYITTAVPTDSGSVFFFGKTRPSFPNLGVGRVCAIVRPTGGRRCLRYGTLLKRGFGVRSSWSRSGSFNGLPRPGVARELPFKSHFKGEARGEVFFDSERGRV